MGLSLTLEDVGLSSSGSGGSSSSSSSSSSSDGGDSGDSGSSVDNWSFAEEDLNKIEEQEDEIARKEREKQDERFDSGLEQEDRSRRFREQQEEIDATVDPTRETSRERDRRKAEQVASATPDEQVDTGAAERIEKQRKQAEEEAASYSDKGLYSAAEEQEEENRRNRTLEEAGGGSTETESNVSNDWVENATGTADWLAGSTDESIARTFDNEEGGGIVDGATKSGEAAVEGTKQVADSSKSVGENVYDAATGKKSIAEATAGTGEAIVDAATGGKAREWREKFWAQEGDGDEMRRRIRAELSRESGDGDLQIGPATIDGGLVSGLSSFNTAARVGLDSIVDSPTPDGGVNAQDVGSAALTFATGSDSKEELAEKAVGAQDTVNRFNKGLGEGWKTAIDKTPLKDNNFARNVAPAVVGTGFEWFLADPVESTTTVASGVDSETGETEGRGEPLDLFDVATAGVGSLGKVRKFGTKADELLNARKADEVTDVRKTDEVTEATDATKVDEAAQGGDNAARGAGKGETKTDTTGGLSGSGGVTGALAALGGALAGGKGLRKMGKYSFWDEAASGADEFAGAGDEAAAGFDETGGYADLDSVDEFDGLSSSIDIGDDTARYSEDLADTSSIFDEGEGVTAGATRGGDETDINSLLSSSYDEFSGATDEVTTKVDEADGGATGDDTFKLFSDAGDDLDGGSLTTAFDDFATGTDDSVSLADDGDDLFRLSDETDNSLDEGGKTRGDGTVSLADEPLSSGDETTSVTKADSADEGTSVTKADSADEGTSVTKADGADGGGGGTFGTTIRKFWDDLPNWMKIGGGLFVGGTLLDEYVDFGGGGGDSDRDPGPQGKERYKATAVHSYEYGGSAFEILYGSDKTEWNTRGYAVYLGTDKNGTFISKGGRMVLSTSARPTSMTPVAGEGNEAVFKPRFGTRGQADDAYAAFIKWLQQKEDETKTPDDTPPEPEQAPSVDGSLTVPDSVKQGVGFEAKWSATLTGNVAKKAGTLTLALAAQDSLVPLAEDDFVLGGGSSGDSGTFTISSGWPAVAPGDYALYAVVTENGNPGAQIAKTTLTVKPSDEGDKSKEGSAWGDPQMVKELPHDWYLYAQVKEDGSNETRFMVVGRREDGTHIYLNNEGRAITSTTFFPTVEAAAAAFKKWLARLKNGNVPPEERPSPKAGRPDASSVKKDAARKDEKSVGGLLSRLTSMAKRKPATFAAGTLVTLVVAYYIYSNQEMIRGVSLT